MLQEPPQHGEGVMVFFVGKMFTRLHEIRPFSTGFLSFHPCGDSMACSGGVCADDAGGSHEPGKQLRKLQDCAARELEEVLPIASVPLHLEWPCLEPFVLF